MRLDRPRSETKQASKGHLPSRRLAEFPVLLALAAILAGVAGLVLLLTPRAPGEDSPEAGFTRDMEIHHAQAVRMAETVRERTEDPAIRVLATDIVLTQQAEIGEMRGWLEAWGLRANSSEPPMAWMGHPQATGSMPGMATPEDLARLQQASPEEADEQFLRLMIPHHQAAVAMAEAVLEHGGDQPEVRRFAQRTVTEQQGEIRGMEALLQRKGLSPEDSEPSLGLEGHTSREHPSLASALQDTARLSPLAIAVLAAAWLGIDTLYRRQARVGLAEPVASSPIWRAVAVGGLFASAALHLGLAPTHLEEATSHGVFFCVAGVAAAIIAAAVLAWPSRPTYLAGAGLSFLLIVLWAVFRFVPPPGAETAEAVDVVGLLTKATELVAIISSAVLWFRAHRAHQSDVADKPVVVNEDRA